MGERDGYDECDGRRERGEYDECDGRGERGEYDECDGHGECPFIGALGCSSDILLR